MFDLDEIEEFLQGEGILGVELQKYTQLWVFKQGDFSNPSRRSRPTVS